ncbi:uncharacterized protein LOC134273792 [Saccostrea cucullata]|uniref:uncharacterized protein LOC134273792 n=1 Tax=Saccostrea cuccullata TaxID=36930 RepID=UPI002ED5999F
MDHITRLSEVLFVGLCRKIGTPTEVAIRRDVLDMWEMIEKPVSMYRELLRLWSGSYGEGFRFTSSDLDVMLWHCRSRLITDISQSRNYDISKDDIVLMEDFDTPPGFVRLRPLALKQNKNKLSCVVVFNGRAYISSFLWREMFFQSMANDEFFRHKNISTHGPCTSGFINTIEFDHAFCFASKYWPKQMRSWVDRCRRHTWPPAPVLEKILRKGYHCVPIESKIVSTCNELEWRLSFSRAEQQLVYTMNHTQFLCYGLLKIFLKEVINYRKEPLLCSYYMKTTMFWMIQQGHLRWCPRNLLDCFWKCFKYLIHCIYRGDFPNFFVPQNNMIINRIVGDALKFLLQQLYQYYRMGVSCLLLSPTLRTILEPALCSPSFVLSTADGEFISIADKDMCVMSEMFKLSFPNQHIEDCYLYLKSIDALSKCSFSPYQLLTLQYGTSEVLVHLAFTIANARSTYTHRYVYTLDRISYNMIKLAVRLGPVSSLLYLALYYYRTSLCDKTLHIIDLSKQRLPQDFVIYPSNIVNKQRYNEVVGNLPLSRRMKVASVKDIYLHNNIQYIEELCLEQTLSLQNGNNTLMLPSHVMVKMLSILCHFRLGNRSQFLQSLTDLQALLLYDDGKYVHLHLRDISWQILGICQQVVGDLHGALRSYQESLRQVQFHKIQEATFIRIENVREQIHRNIQS